MIRHIRPGSLVYIPSETNTIQKVVRGGHFFTD